MRATVRALLVACVLLLTATLGRAQAPPTADRARAQDLFARIKAGQEEQVPCDELNVAVGRDLVDLASARYNESLERLTVAYRLAVRAGRCAGADALQGTALNGLSDNLMGLGEFSHAREAAEESVRIHEGLHDDVGLAEAWNRIGNARWWGNDTPGALEALHRALDISTAAQDRVGQGRAWNNLANIHKATGELETALDYLTQALRVFEESGDSRRAAVVANNIGLVYFNRGEYATALEYNRRGLDLNRRTDSQLRLGASFDSAGNIYRALGAYRLALQFFQQALAIRTSLGEPAGVMETTHNIGLVHFSLGDYQLAIDAYKRSLSLNRTRGLHSQSFVAEAMRNIGAAAWQLGERDRAAADFRESLAIARAERLRGNEAELLHDLGRMALAEGRTAEASRLFDEALALCRRIGDQAGITETLTSLAAADVARGNYEAALDIARRALENATVHDHEELRWGAQTLIGIAQRRLHRSAEARQALTDAVRSIERLSNEVIINDTLRQRFFETKLSPYHELVGLLVEQHAYDEALELAERSKARTLMQLLTRNPIDDNATLSAAERAQRARLRDRLFALNRDIEKEQAAQSTAPNRAATLVAARREAREALAALEASLAAAHPELAAVRGDVSPLRFAETNRVLTDPATAILEYAVAERRLFVFVLTTDGSRVNVDAREVAIGAAELAKRADRFRDRIASRDFGVIDDARTLDELLIGPVRDAIAGKSRIIVIPDGPLWNVPFQALHGPAGYLIEAAAVSYAPSITVIREIQRLPRSTGPRTLLALGKSTFGPPSSSTLAPLPEAEAQVALIRNIYGPDRSAVLVGGDATESQFKAAAPHYAVLHLATHGVLDENSPLYSYLVLSSERQGTLDDGHLEAWEILGMKLTAEVVVLAACDTGRGRIAPGEGVIGTMWALFAAGARSMVVSQFAVESKSATAMLVAFHRRLAADRSAKSAQLRAAAIELLRTPRFAHPYYWASFILVGDPD